MLSPEEEEENVEDGDVNDKKKMKISSKRCFKTLLIISHVFFLFACVFMAVFCMIRFVLPISFNKTSENFMIFMIPSSISQSSISAAGLVATTSTLSWPLVCFSIVQMLPLVFSLYWMFVQFNELQTLTSNVIPMFTLLMICCVTWIVQITLSVLLSVQIRNRLKYDTNIDDTNSSKIIVI